MTFLYVVLIYCCVGILIFAIGAAFITADTQEKATTLQEFSDTIETSQYGFLVGMLALFWPLWIPFVVVLGIIAVPTWIIFRLAQWLVWEIKKPKENV